MIKAEHVSTVTTGYLINKIETHLTTGFLPDSFSDKVMAEKSSLNFDINPDGIMQVFEKLGPSYFKDDETMKQTKGDGVSGYRFKNNECGEIMAKDECFRHFISFIKNTIYSNENRLKSIKGLCPVFMLNKDRKDSFSRLSKKIEIMKSIINGDKKIIEEYCPNIEVHRLDPEKEMRIITPLSETQTFFYVNLNNFEIKQVKARMIDFRDYFIRSGNVDGYIEYGFFDDNNNRVHTAIIKDASHLQTNEIAINSNKRFLFLTKEKALELLSKEKGRISKAIEDIIDAKS